MNDILHRMGAKASAEDTYAALATIDGLSGWWTEDTTGDADTGGLITFRFGGDRPAEATIEMKVLEAKPTEAVAWEVVAGPEEWIGTTVRFDLKAADDFTVVLFRHEGWAEPGELMHHCSTKWATFLMSLKQMLETGTGAPAPNDQPIDDWD